MQRKFDQELNYVCRIMMNENLLKRANDLCELCGLEQAKKEFIVNEEIGYQLDNLVALCENCETKIKSNSNEDPAHWQCLAASIWSEFPSVQALSYRVLYLNSKEDWANDILNSVDLPESVVKLAIGIYDVKEVHKDSNGLVLENGDTVVLTQVLNVKGANFMAPKGTIVKKIKLVPDNVRQIEGKINDQTIVILTQFVKKG